jgi:hypothetical protein
LREAATSWSELVPEAMLVVVREPLAATYCDTEVIQSLGLAPWWKGAGKKGADRRRSRAKKVRKRTK